MASNNYSSYSSSSSLSPGVEALYVKFTPTYDYDTNPTTELPHYLEVLCEGGDNVDPNIFGYQRDQIDPTTGTYPDFFSFVCAPNDLEELPIGGPTENSGNRFRYHTVKAFFRSRTELDFAVTSIKADIQFLLDALHRQYENGDPTKLKFTPDV